MDTSSITTQEAVNALVVILLALGAIALCYQLGTFFGNWWWGMTK